MYYNIILLAATILALALSFWPNSGATGQLISNSGQPAISTTAVFKDCSSEIERFHALLFRTLKNIGDIAIKDNSEEVGNAILDVLLVQVIEADQILSKWRDYRKDAAAKEINQDFQQEGIKVYTELEKIYRNVRYFILPESPVVVQLSEGAQKKIEEELEKVSPEDRNSICLGGKFDSPVADPRNTSDAINEKVKGGQRQSG